MNSLLLSLLMGEMRPENTQSSSCSFEMSSIIEPHDFEKEKDAALRAQRQQKRALKKAKKQEKKAAKDAALKKYIEARMTLVKGVCVGSRVLRRPDSPKIERFFLLSPVIVGGDKRDSFEIIGCKKMAKMQSGDYIELFVTKKAHGTFFTAPYKKINIIPRDRD